MRHEKTATPPLPKLVAPMLMTPRPQMGDVGQVDGIATRPPRSGVWMTKGYKPLRLSMPIKVYRNQARLDIAVAVAVNNKSSTVTQCHGED